MYSFDRGDLDFSLFFCVVKNLEYCYHCFIDVFIGISFDGFRNTVEAHLSVGLKFRCF